jgi:hypothetical protein
MRKMYFILMLTLTMVLTSCSDNGTEPSRDVWMPFKNGSQWVYFVDDGKKTYLLTLTCHSENELYYQLTDGTYSYFNFNREREGSSDFHMDDPLGFEFDNYDTAFEDELTLTDTSSFEEHTITFKKNIGISKYVLSYKDVFDATTYTLVEYKP